MLRFNAREIRDKCVWALRRADTAYLIALFGSFLRLAIDCNFNYTYFTPHGCDEARQLILRN